MANNKTTSEKETKTTAKSASVKELEEKIAKQQSQIEELIALLQNSGSIKTSTVSNDDIGADEEILVVSLTPNKLNLVGNGGTVLFSFENMYEEQYIDYTSLKEIVRLNRDMAKNGRFYILDERVVNKLRLKNNYKHVLSPEQLQRILSTNVDSAIELYKLANDTQKNTIIELVKQYKFQGNHIDYNLLKELSELSHIDLMNIEDVTQIDMNVKE